MHDDSDGLGVFMGCLSALLIYAVVGAVIGLIYLIVR